MEQIFENVKEIEKRISSFLSDDEKTAETLMIENAACALEKHIKKNCSRNKNNKIVILCGAGNNGADGYTLARHLAGKYTTVIIKCAEPKTPFCIRAFENLKPLFNSLITLKDLNSFEEAADADITEEE